MTIHLKDQFNEYFQELHGYAPYPWQQLLADRLVKENGHWPDAIDLPTGSGKTACIDIAVFALACQASRPMSDRTAPRRVFFCVNRRVIVDEAYQRSRRIAQAIWEAECSEENNKPILREVAKALRSVSGTVFGDEIPPLDAVEMRGGIYRDNRWARSATQPAIICTTLDQLGSRLLFRGYGVSRGAAPIQAALVAYDSLILLDEAHISPSFLQTLNNVQRYLDPKKWTEQEIGVFPMRVVPMTATPPAGIELENMYRLSDEDRKNDQLCKRLSTNKPAMLVNDKDVAKEAAKRALETAKGNPAAIGIIVNRIATARSIYKSLCEEQVDATIELVIGSMRPIDRDEQAKRLQPLIGADRPAVSEQISITVSTQCLEVGADYDFDMLITECASLDALRQRFGRLNRAGRDIEAKAVILVHSKGIKANDKLSDEKPLDPIYGNALARTWNWLNEHASEKSVDFGIDAMDTLLDKHGDDGHIPQDLLAPSATLNAPVMLPAYVDFWCQTSPRPVPDPDISLFIHGSQHSEPDIQVCWRSDLVEDGTMSREHWCDTVALLSPSSAECMSVPISRLRRWLKGQASASDGDLLGIACEDNDDDKKNSKKDDSKNNRELCGVLWRGSLNSVFLKSPDELRPGDTLVLPTSMNDAESLGHLPTLAPDTTDPHEGTEETQECEQSQVCSIDMAEVAFHRAQDRAALRLHRSLRAYLPAGHMFDDLLDRAADEDNPPRASEWQQMLANAVGEMDDLTNVDLKKRLEELANPNNGLRIECYPDKHGVVLTTRNRLGSTTDWYIPTLDDGNDESSMVNRKDAITLVDHTKHVVDRVRSSVELLLASERHKFYKTAAQLHDLGKGDERFQGMLRRTHRTDTWLLAAHDSTLLAKSDGMPQTRSERIAARHRAGLPDGFRHEMLSVQLAEQSTKLPEDSIERDLVLHLIAAHHGHARPFAPVVFDENPPSIEIDGLVMATDDRLLCPSHRLDSGIAERFWSLTRRYGWWGLAYLEAILRLADQQASASEDTVTSTTGSATEPAGAST